MNIKGKVWRFPQDDINTDLIRRKMYAHLPIKEQAVHCLEQLDQAFGANVKPGDIVVAGRNFGAGSSTPVHLALLGLGIGAVMAESFGRVFFRSAIAGAAYEEAGIGPEELDMAEVYDLSSALELDWYENIGLCKEGEAEKLLNDGDTTIGGRIPVNPSGGVLSSTGTQFVNTAGFGNPIALAFDSQDNLYVVNQGSRARTLFARSFVNPFTDTVLRLSQEPL